VRPIVVERRRRSGARLDFRRPPLNLHIPSFRRVRIRIAVEAAEELERHTRSFLGWEPEQVL
jgi:hypothetical protein